MTPEATGATAQHHDLQDRHVALREGDTCVQCHRVGASPLRFGLCVCEHCLFGLAMAPLGFGTSDGDADAPVQTISGSAWGAYLLGEEIGRGGMGVIHRAVHRETNEAVAIKTVLPEHLDDEEMLARFRREAEAVQRLDHPHAMPIFEVGCSDDGLPFFSMRLARGGSLHHLIAKYRGRWRQIAELMVKISGAVHHAHLRGILHRDIKPGNILFTEDHEPLVTDFGLAKPLTGSNDLTRSFAVLGTPTYIAPEQAAGKTRELTAAADIYSLGAVLYELLTGRPPFVGDNPLEVLQQVGRKSPARPCRLVPAVPEALEQTCLRCLERAPANRYSSAQALADDLKRWLDGRPLARRPVYTLARSLVRRHPAASAWCGGLTALTAFVWTVWMLVGRPTAILPPLVSVGVVIDDLGQGATPRRVARGVQDELCRHLSASGKFCLLNNGHGDAEFASAVLDPLGYGRAIHAQMILMGCVNRVGRQSYLVVRLMRCDTGKIVWRSSETLPSEQTLVDWSATVKTLVDNLLTSWDEQRREPVHPTSPATLPDAQAFYTRAMDLSSHKNRRDMEAAIELFRRASEVDPHFAQARAMLAFAQWCLGNTYEEPNWFSLAERTAKEALALDPYSAQAHRVIASCYFSRIHYEEALEEFETAVQLNPLSSGCCQSLGNCLRRMGHPDQAIPWFRRAIQLDPARGYLHGSLGEALALCDLDDEADAELRRAVELDMDKPDSQFSIVALRTWQRRFDEARRLCKNAHERFPEYRFGPNFTAWIEFCDGKLLEAQPIYEKLRAENSYEHQWIFHGGINPASALAYIAHRTGSPEQSRILAQDALSIDFELLTKYPHNCRILHDLAATYAIVADEENAFRFLKESLSAGWAEHCSTQIDPRFSTLAPLPLFKTLLDDTKPKYVRDKMY